MEPTPETRTTLIDQSPEARRRRAMVDRSKLQGQFKRNLGPASRFFTVVKRVAVGTYSDGFIHAGNLAYMAIISLFPFFIVIAAVFKMLGEDGQREASIGEAGAEEREGRRMRELRQPHERPRKKAESISRPRGVAYESGWNCSPAIGSDSCSIAMTTPSGDVAVTRSGGGTSASASEW